MHNLTVFTSNMSKNIAFKISKHYFINFNTPLYDTPYVKGFIFIFTTSLKYYLFIIYNSFLFYLSLFLCVCFSSPSKNNNPTPLWPPPDTTHSMSPPKPPPTTNHRIDQPTPTRERFHQREIDRSMALTPSIPWP